MGEWNISLAKTGCDCLSAVRQPTACHINMTLLIEYRSGDSNRKISQAQEVNKVKKPGAE